jgi:hypothetical protein
MNKNQPAVREDVGKPVLRLLLLALCGAIAVPSPGRAQSRPQDLSQRFISQLSVMAIGQNLFDPAYAEFAGPASLLLPTEIPRSASLRLRWTF